MDYKVEPVKISSGEGIKIEKGRRSYEQFSGQDGLFARVFHAPYEKEGQLVDTGFHGVVFRTHFQDTDADYEQFRGLSERLQQVSGEEVPHSKARFMEYISHSGLEQELSRIGAVVRINLKDKEALPDNMESWLNSKGHCGGLVSDLAAYAIGFGILGNSVPPEEVGKTMLAYGVVLSGIEGITGMMLPERSRIGWCGLLHRIGFFPTKRAFKSKIRNPNFMLEKFMQNYQNLEARGSSVGNQKQYTKNSKKAHKHFGVLEDMFPFTQHQRGFSITYDHQNRDEVVSFVDYVLGGGPQPQLSAPRKAGQQKKVEEEKIETKPLPSNFVNPWEIEVPRLGDKKDE